MVDITIYGVNGYDHVEVHDCDLPIPRIGEKVYMSGTFNGKISQKYFTVGQVCYHYFKESEAHKVKIQIFVDPQSESYF